MATPTLPTAPPAELLIDHYLPRYDVGLVEHTLAEADLATTWQAPHDMRAALKAVRSDAEGRFES